MVSETMYTIYMSNSRDDVHWYFVIDRNAYVLTQMCNTRVIIINLSWINMIWKKCHTLPVEIQNITI